MGTTLQYLGWDAFILTTPEGVRIMLDPFITGDMKYGVPASTFKPDEIKGLDMIVASHGSTDHFGNGFEILRGNPGCKLLCGIDVMFQAAKAGFGGSFDGTVEQMVSGCYYHYKDVHIRCLDARHISFSYYEGMPVTGTAMCYYIKIDNSPSFFFGGDTSITSDFRLWGELYRPDVALLGIGGSIHANGRSLDELDPVEAAIGAGMLGSKLVIPMHYDPKLHPDYLEWFHRECAGRLDNCKCLDLSCGDVVEFGEPLPHKIVK